MDENRDLLGAIEVEKDVMLIILFVVMLGAGFCIICSQIAFVIRKTREIGILKAMGATTGQVVGVFLAQSSLVGVLGVASGLALGTGGVWIRNDFLLWMRRLTGRELFPQSIYSFAQIPAEVLPSDVTLICGVSLAMCLLAGVVPAWIAASMRPVEALRND
jgi:lipoprotein-releasing system permease protein